MKKVSVIVPVYNVEKYLRRCLDSLINQTLSDIEIIVVNDASPDCSADIMREYEEKYPDKIICVYLKKNIKQGGARNVGLRKSTGEYIMFVDSDDWVDTTICEEMYLSAMQTGSDLVICDYKKVMEGTGEEKLVMEVGNEVDGVPTPGIKKVLLSMKAFPFAKLIHRELLFNHNLFFPEGIQYEDQAVVPFLFLYSKRLKKLNNPLYFYNSREDSTMNTKNSIHHFQRMEAVRLFYDRAKKDNFYPELKQELDMFFIRSYYFYMLDSCLERFDAPPLTKMQEISTAVREICPDYLDNYYIDKLVDPIYLQMALLNDRSSEFLIEQIGELRRRKYSYLNFYRQTKERVGQLLAYCREHSYTIAIWGAGQKGRDFLAVNDPERKEIRYVIDGNPKREGEQLPTGHVISSFSSTMQQIDVILVINKNFYGDVYYKVNAVDNLFVVNLDLYLIYTMETSAFFR